MKRKKLIKRGSPSKNKVIIPGASLSVPDPTGFVHAFASNSKNSGRSRMGKEVIKESMQPSHKVKVDRHAKQRSRNKLSKLSELLQVDCDDERGKVIMDQFKKDTKKKHLFISGTNLPNIKNNPYENESTTLSFRKFLIHDDSDTFQGIQCCNKDGQLIFRLLPRELSIGGKDTNLNYLLPSLQDALTVSNNKYRGKAIVFGWDNVNPNEHKYFWLGSAPNRAAVGINTSHWPKNLKSKTKKNLVALLNQTNIKASEYIERSVLFGLRQAVDMMRPDYTFKGTHQDNIWPSIAIGKNAYASAHVDKDFFYSLAIVHSTDKECRTEDGSSYKLDCPPSAYFMFPERGVGITLHPGDMLLFNPSELHCISSLSEEFKEKLLFCLSLYLKTSTAAGNNNN